MPHLDPVEWVLAIMAIMVAVAMIGLVIHNLIDMYLSMRYLGKAVAEYKQAKENFFKKTDTNMSASPDIKDALTNRLMLEAFSVLADMYKSQSSSASGSGVMAWLQHEIAVAEASNNMARAMTANMVLKAFAEEWVTPADFNTDRLEERVRQSIDQTVNA